MLDLAQKNIAMLGEGFYSRVSRGPKAVIDNASDLLMQAIDRVPLGAGETFTIADYGAADGGTSADLMTSAVARIRDRAPAQAVAVHYTDLPGADFGTLFRTVDCADGYASRFGDVAVFASGRSFYRQILPSKSLHLGFSASAMHYLSTMPGVIEDHVHSVRATPQEQLPFRAQSLADWETILLHRAHELVDGGRIDPRFKGTRLQNFAEEGGDVDEGVGVLVTEVEASSPAWRYGLRPGDLVVGANRRGVRNLGELGELAKRGRPISLQVYRNGEYGAITLR